MPVCSIFPPTAGRFRAPALALQRLLDVAAVWGDHWHREQIVAMLPRVTRIGPASLEAPSQTSVAAPLTNGGDDAFKRLEAMIDPALLVEGCQLIEKTVPRNSHGEKTNEIKYLTTLSSALMFAGLFERSNGLIWGSQWRFIPLSIPTTR